MALTPTAEVFVSYETGEDLPQPGAGYEWVGAGPRLTTRDDFTTYGHTSFEVEAGTMIGYQTTGTVGASVKLAAQVRLNGYVGEYAFTAYVTDHEFAWVAFGDATATVDGSDWVDVEWDIPVDGPTRAALNAAPFTRVLLWAGVISEGPPFPFFGDEFDVSYLSIVGTPPLRLMQRGDGLGMGSGRVFGAGTRQGSNRVFDSL